jgi:thymidylate synthase
MNREFQEIIKGINALGSFNEPRGLEVQEQLLAIRKINPLYPIADFESRPFNWKYFAGELAWYLKRDNDIEYISQFSNFWSKITNPNSNEINSNYGTLLFGEQLQWVVDSLSNDRNTRQAIAMLNQPKFQFKDNKDFVCTMYLNFWIRDNKLHMKVQMRSNDIFYGLTYDAPFFSFVHQHVLAMYLERHNDYLKLGDYYHCADNIHYYKPFFNIASDIINERPKEPIRMQFKKLFTCDGGYQLTPFGRRFIKEVDLLLSIDATPDDWKKMVLQYTVK